MGFLGFSVGNELLFYFWEIFYGFPLESLEVLLVFSWFLSGFLRTSCDFSYYWPKRPYYT